MASKKKVSKEELRRAMSEAKKKHSSIKKIEHPLARYNDIDQLVCIVCKTPVRNEALWPLHLNSKPHKENIEMAKRATFKRPLKPSESPEPKRQKSILKNSGQVKSSVKESLPSDFFESSSKVNHNVSSLKNDVINKTEVESSAEKVSEIKDNKDTALPEGFFDDPIQDAKARNVEYKNPVEEEWERFQKEIKEETAQSAQIIGDDQEEAASERQLDVIEEQLRNWSRVMDLVKQRELVPKAPNKQDSSDSSSEEEDFDEFLDWRAKKSY